MSDDIPIVDAHQHFWDLSRNYHPWLSDEPTISFRYGDYRALKRNYLPPDYRADTGGFNVVGSVYVEAEWNPADPVGETVWVHEIAKQYGLPNAVVAQAWLDRENVEEVLAQQAKLPLVRSIRHKPSAAASPGEVRLGQPGSMDDPRWRRGYALLSRYGLSFDLQTPWWHLEEAARLAQDFPETQVILNHTGLPADRSELGVDQWHAATRRLARRSNVVVKISGLGVPGQAWTVEANRRIVLRTIDLFGVDRCMFASNYPVDKLIASFDTIFSGFQEITAGFPRTDRRKLFYENAVRVYGITNIREEKL